MRRLVNTTASRATAAIVATAAIMYLVPFPVYGAFEAAGAVKLPEEGSAAQFLLSVLVIKIGVAVAFVALFSLARPSLAGRWWPYALVWWLMFAVVEVGQAIGPAYSAAEAVAGIISEAIYFPLSSAVVSRIVGTEGDAS
ncbi:MAG: hypothetical protein JSV80_01780 [Acidobacteriota bacterium]|nr:MAG: hypothetical protein JSV80_01780 [Acidobacteriota bacterium]